MSTTRQLYRRIDGWVRNLSRVEHAVTVGFLSTLGLFAVGVLLPGSKTFETVGLGIIMTIFNYAFNPQHKS